MTISTETCAVTVSGNDSTTEFAYNFIIPYQPDGVTPAVDVFMTIEDATLELVWGVDYSVQGVGESVGGTITFPLTGSPLPTGGTLDIIRAAEYVQPYAFPNQNLTPANVEAALDWLCMTVQQLNLRVSELEDEL